MERIEDRFGRTLAKAINWGVAIGLFIGLLMAAVARAEPAPIDFTRAVYIDGPITDSVTSLGSKLRSYTTEFTVDGDKVIKNDGWNKPVYIILNSPGGSVLYGDLFISSMKEVKARGVKIYCYNQHLAASMAFQIMLHCDTRYALKSSLFLWHEARVMLNQMIGTEDTLRTIADDLNSVNTAMYEDLKLLPIDESTLRRHYTHETLHMAPNLNKLAPGWVKVYDAIPGLLDVPSNVPRPVQNPFEFFRRMGIFIYIAPGVIK